MERLPKGFPVHCYFNYFECREQCIEDGISYKEDTTNNGIIIEGFVTGDAEKGTSIVALDNSEICLFITESFNEEIREKVRVLLRRGHISEKEFDEAIEYDANDWGAPPVCPY